MTPKSFMSKTMGDVIGESGARVSDLDAVVSIRNELEEIEKLMRQNSAKLERHMKLLDDLPDHLWIGSDEAYAAQQHLLPLAKEASSDVNEALTDAVVLKLALSTDAIENDLRSSIIETLTNQDDNDTMFTQEELQMSLKEAKRQYKGDHLRMWKSARKDL